VGLNGTEIGTNDQLGQTCALNAADLLTLSCLKASGGLAGGLIGGSSDILGITTPLAAAVDPVAAFSVTSSSGTGSEPISVLPATGTQTPSAETARSLAPAASTSPASVAGQILGKLPRTGAAAAALAMAALAALLSGAALRLLGRRRLAV
jgi:LPXTG-motif cell wall-anchored protein